MPTTLPQPLALEPPSLARVRLGGFDFALPIVHVQRVLRPAIALRPLPRRQGPVAGLLTTPDGVLPVLDLSAWLRLPEAATAGRVAEETRQMAGEEEAPGLVLVLQQGARRLGVRVSAVEGVRAVPAQGRHRLHHEVRPDELFDAVADWPGAPAPLPVLEVERLLDLLDTWVERPESAGQGERAGSALQEPAGVVVRVGPLRVWLPARLVLEIMPAAPAEKAGAAAAHQWSLTWWRGRPLPMVSLQPSGAGAGPGTRGDAGTGHRPCVVVLGEPHGAGLLGLRVDALDRLCAWPGKASTLEPGSPGLSPHLDAVALEDGGAPIYRLDVDSLLQAHPERDLARAADAAGPAGLSVDRGAGQPITVPFIVFEAPALRCIAADRVREIVRWRGEAGAQGLGWRGRWVPLVGELTDPPAGAAAAEPQLLMLTEAEEGVVARPIRSLRFMVPAGRGRLQRLARRGEAVLSLLSLPEQQPPLMVQQVDW